MFLKISQNSQENTCARASFLIKLQASGLKKRLWHRCFPVNFVKFLRAPFFTEHIWTTASVNASIFNKVWKTSFWVHFGPFSWPKKTSKQDFSKKFNQVNLKTICYCNFIQFMYKYWVPIFHRTWKPHFELISGPFLVQRTQKQGIAPKRHLNQL